MEKVIIDYVISMLDACEITKLRTRLECLLDVLDAAPYYTDDEIIGAVCRMKEEDKPCRRPLKAE